MISCLVACARREWYSWAPVYLPINGTKGSKAPITTLRRRPKAPFIYTREPDAGTRSSIITRMDANEEYKIAVWRLPKCGLESAIGSVLRDRADIAVFDIDRCLRSPFRTLDTYWQRRSATYRMVLYKRSTRIPSRIFGSGSTLVRTRNDQVIDVKHRREFQLSNNRDDNDQKARRQDRRHSCAQKGWIATAKLS